MSAVADLFLGGILAASAALTVERNVKLAQPRELKLESRNLGMGKITEMDLYVETLLATLNELLHLNMQ